MALYLNDLDLFTDLRKPVVTDPSMTNVAHQTVSIEGDTGLGCQTEGRGYLQEARPCEYAWG